MVKKKRFVKRREWEISKPKWKLYFLVVILGFSLEFFIGAWHDNSLLQKVGFYLYIFLWPYFLFGKYPYWFKSYYEEV